MTTPLPVNLGDVFTLDRSTIEQNVKPKSRGVYVLSKDRTSTHYAGRSDKNLQERLVSHIGKPYVAFRGAYTDTEEDAFYQECQLYHYYGGSERLDNESHPQRPNASKLLCPKCSIFG